MAKPRIRPHQDALAQSGIVMRSRAGTVGFRLYTRRWMRDVENLTDRKSVHVARLRARAGIVLDVQVIEGRLLGLVAGSQSQPFEVNISVRETDDVATATAIELFDSNPGSAAEAVGGAMADELGFALIPDALADMQFECTCPNAEQPCLHALVVCYLAAEAIDRDPQLLLTLRGWTPARLAGAIGEESLDEPSVTEFWADAVPRVPVPQTLKVDVVSVLAGPAGQELARAASADPLEQLRLIADIEDFYHALMSTSDGDQT